MARSFDEVLQEMVNKDYSELCGLAKICLVDCVESLKAIVDEKHAIALLISFIGAAVASDGKYSELEKKLMTDLFGDYESIGKVAVSTDSDQYETLNSIVDDLPADIKAKMCMLATCILAVDEHIDKNEYGYLMKLME